MPKKMNIFSELKRRRVFNTVALYIVGAWVALQVAELALPALDIPETAIRYVWIGAFALFPLVLIFGWRYDISKGGIRRTLAPGAEPLESETLHGVDRWFIGGLSTAALAVIAVMLVRIGQIEPEILRVAPENSIAVMPFEVCDGRSSDQPIAFQLAIEVLNRLSEHGGLKVISRVTTYNLAGFGWSAPRISGHLGVQYVLTGEVCRDGETLTISSELRDKDDFIVSRKSYEQIINPYSQIELRVATQVADAVAAQLGYLTPLAPDAPVNRLAYEQLLIGRQFLENRGWQKAKESFERALELQPGFPEAVFELAIMEIRLNPDKARVERLASARQKAEEALVLAEGEVEGGAAGFYTHFVIGRIQHTLARWEEASLWRQAGELDEQEVARRKEMTHERFSLSERHLRTALGLNPSHIETYEWLVNTIERLGIERRGEAFEMMQRGLERDPFNKDYNATLAFRMAGRGRYREAMELLDRFAVLPDGKRELWWTQLEIQNNMGRYDDKLATQIEILREDPDAYLIGGILGHLYWLTSEMVELDLPEEAEWLHQLLMRVPLPERNFLLRMPRDDWYQKAIGEGQQVAARWVEKYGGMSNQEILDKWWLIVGHVAESFWVTGERERAIELAEGLRHQQQHLQWAERQSGGDMELAQWYTEMGRRDDAVTLWEQSLDYLQREVDHGIRHPGTLAGLAYVNALLGNREDALDTLEMAVNYGHFEGYGGYGGLLPNEDAEVGDDVTDPFASIRGDPRFLALADRAESIVAQQRSNIQAMLARNDMEALLVPVIALWEKRVAALAETD